MSLAGTVEIPLYPPRAATDGLTVRAFAAGSLLAVFLCGVNSYLTLSFGVIEEGPTIAALFFFAFFFLSKRKITSTELVIVATMGSAGGSLGFISNFYAAKAMTGPVYGYWEMAFFAMVTSLVGILFVIPLRELLILREKLPWPGSKATAGVIGVLSERGDPRQPVYLLITLVVAMAYVIANTDGGFGLVPDSTVIPLFGLGAYGAAVAWSPFALGGAYLMGLRTCVGFLVGGIALLIMAPHTPDPGAPHRYVWPGIAFLVSSGLTLMVVNWKVTAAAVASLFTTRSKNRVDDDPVLGPRVFAVLGVAALAICLAFLGGGMKLGIGLILMLVVVGGFLQKRDRHPGRRPDRVQPGPGHGRAPSGALRPHGGLQHGGEPHRRGLRGREWIPGRENLTGDMAYGRWFKVPSRWQFWTQFTTMIPCALVSAWVFTQIQTHQALTLEGPGLPAPVAKIWAASALIFDGTNPMPPGVVTAMLVAAAAGIVWVLVESRERITRFIPSSIGFGWAWGSWWPTTSRSFLAGFSCGWFSAAGSR